MGRGGGDGMIATYVGTDTKCVGMNLEASLVGFGKFHDVNETNKICYFHKTLIMTSVFVFLFLLQIIT